MKIIQKTAFFLFLIFFDPLEPTPENKNVKLASVCVPVADIRIPNKKTNQLSPFILQKNTHHQSIFSTGNIDQKTQVLFGEPLKIIKEEADWILVQIPGQKYFSESKQYLPLDGWISKSAIVKKTTLNKPNLVVKTLWAPVYRTNEQGEEPLFVSMGTRLIGRKNSDGNWNLDLTNGSGQINDEYVEHISYSGGSIKALRSELLTRAKLFLQSPYIWGGCSAPAQLYPDKVPQYLMNQATGVDCSGFVHVLFKSLGLQCPRNSNDQYLFSIKLNKKNEPLSGNDLRPGDLIFFAKLAKDGKTPLRISHVAIYLGQNEQGDSLIIEGQGITDPYGVRIISTKNFPRLGCKNVSEIKTGDIYNYYDDVLRIKLKSYIYLGTYFRPEKLVEMRKDFLAGA